MVIGLLIVLALVLVLPFSLKIVEHNLEVFLFIMGLLAVIVSGAISLDLFTEILQNSFLYLITAAVLVSGILFKIFKNSIKTAVNKILKHIPLSILVFMMIIILGLASSVITAIIASLLLVEILNILPLKRKQKIHLDIIACFSIGLGAVLTPIGEPLSTVVVSRLNKNFFFLFNEFGIYIIPGIIGLGLVGLLYVKYSIKKTQTDSAAKDIIEDEETYKNGFIRSGKIFLFVFALELLGAGFKPLIDTYVIQLDSRALYWINMISAVLDNATLASAEISINMSLIQVKAILMGLLISGGMLIPGNIPNIISAGKLKIKSSEWARLGVPLGLIIMIVYFIILF
jgi:predicted cation transporter